jgi:hypothetical protein
MKEDLRSGRIGNLRELRALRGEFSLAVFRSWFEWFAVKKVFSP